MSACNGVIRIGRKGIKKFAFGEDGQPGSEPFEVDVVAVFQDYVDLDVSFRQEDGEGKILREDIPRYHTAVVEFVKKHSGKDVTTAEALDFVARLREQYDELAGFFQPKLRQRPDLPDTSEELSAPATLQFSAEES